MACESMPPLLGGRRCDGAEQRPSEPLGRRERRRDAQAAAERALGSARHNAALVAIEPSSGDVLAVANRPVDSSLNRAFEGRYPPGSTFKVVSTAALLRDGLGIDATVPCPPTATVDGGAFRNFEGQARGRVPFRTDFAQSCNTAFVSLAGRLEIGALTEVARSFGLGLELNLALPPRERASPPRGRPSPVRR